MPPLGASWSRTFNWTAILLVIFSTTCARPPGSTEPVGEFDRREVDPAEEAYIFTPPDYKRAGELVVARGDQIGRLKVKIRDAATGSSTFCRVNVIGSDGNYYQPETNDLFPYRLGGPWPDKGLGNRPSKGPIRYFGHFFYTDGTFEVSVPPGHFRMEAWKGLEYHPEIREGEIGARETRSLELELRRSLPMANLGYYAGDPHLHFARRNNEDDQIILDLMEAEDIRFGTISCYNLLDSYTGKMDKQESPQYKGLGRPSIHRRGDYSIISAQEYRSSTYGHLNLFMRESMVLEGQTVDPDDWPVLGALARESRRRSGYAFHAHGGYAQEITADFAHRAANGVELLQFGIYRGIGLEGWYNILNVGYRFPALGASDYPACRKLGDCRTYVQITGEPDFEKWFAGLAKGRSFVTSGPMLLMEVDGKPPGSLLYKPNVGPHRLRVSIQVSSEVAPVTNLQLIVNGRMIKAKVLSEEPRTGTWVRWGESVELTQSSWIAARAFSTAPTGSPDAEAHTNPVYVYLGNKAPYDESSLQALIGSLDRQLAFHQQRYFPQRSRVLDYFSKARQQLLEIRKRQGLPAHSKNEQ